MYELQLRGYVTPDDFSGTETERLQKAFDHAAESDIRKVVLSGDWHADAPLILPEQMYLVIEGTLYADLQNRITDNYSYEQDRIYIQGGTVAGALTFRHVRHVILDQVTVQGDVTAEFARDLRLEEVTVSGRLTLGRGCANVIAQNLHTGPVLLTSKSDAADIPGREPTLRNIVLRSSRCSADISLTAARDFGLLNIQIDHCSAVTVRIGSAEETMEPALYTNLTLTDLELKEGIVTHTPCRGAHIVP